MLLKIRKTWEIFILHGLLNCVVLLFRNKENVEPKK